MIGNDASLAVQAELSEIRAAMAGAISPNSPGLFPGFDGFLLGCRGLHGVAAALYSFGWALSLK